MPPFIDLSGKRFGRLTVWGRAGTSDYGQPKWQCRCDCGNDVAVFGNSLRTGRTMSCGCLHRERVTTHGGTKTSEFTVWQMMIQRCKNPNSNCFASYGGRGIRVCPEWDEFAAFLADMGPRPSLRHTLERTDNDQGYQPDNCRWATPLEQGRNKRNNRRLTLNGETRTIGEWCRHLDMRKTTLQNRLKRMTTAEALTRPVAHKRSGYR